MSLFTSFFPAASSNATPSADACAAGSACGSAVADTQAAPATRTAYRSSETAEGYTVTVNLPGVAKDNLTVDAVDGVLTVTGRRAWQKPEGWTAVHRETPDDGYTLSLAYDETAVDADKITAQLTDGVLRLTLPKAEARKPRKIAVN